MVGIVDNGKERDDHLGSEVMGATVTQKVATTDPDGLPCIIEVEITDATDSEKKMGGWDAPSTAEGTDSATLAALASMAMTLASLAEPEQAAELRAAASALMEGGDDGDA